MFLAERKKQIQNKIDKTTLANIDLLYSSNFIFKKNKHGCIEEDKPLENVAIVQEELTCLDIDGIENLENLPRFVFINKECGNLKVVNDEELRRNINQEKKLHILQIACWCSLCDKCKRKYFFDNDVAIILWIS